MLKKTISSLMTLLAALLLASCASSHSTNHQTSASSTEVAKKNEISITISVTPEGSESAIKNLESSRREQPYESAQSQLQD